tara:strand:- start:62062 stop:68664 length:6603 start_codon:yes stop_codon:yes gene_type:complete
MSEFLKRIQNLSPKQLAVLALRLNNELEQTKSALSAPIAIVGMGCRFPGKIDGPDTYWRFLVEGGEAISEVPQDRWSAVDWFDPDSNAAGKMSAKCGGFLDDIAGFDHASFGITPREAATMDPQQRLLLEIAWETLEHAGINPNSLTGSPTGVFVGMCNSDHFQRVLHRGPESIDAYLASGNASSVAAGRIAYTFGFSGPAISIDTACSSSLVALHQAISSLRTGECSLALAGGVNIISEPETMVALSKAGMLAPDGRCKAFDSSADGFSRGEGCGLIAIKRLADAERDNDRIFAVIRGSALNQDGRSAGLTVPSRSAQEALIAAALANAGVSPQDIDYVEAHGTGTRLGDPIEIRALSAALTSGRAPDQPLIVGSAKTNFGHLESAAGIAGVIKTTLALHYGVIPPHLHFKSGNPDIDWEHAGIVIPTEARDWPNASGRRLAGVSSFGFSGTNAHVILESVEQLPQTISITEKSSVCLPVSARSEAALLAQASRLSHALISCKTDIEVVAHTLGAGRAHLSERLAVTASTKEEAVDSLMAFVANKTSPRLQRGHVEPGQAPGIVFLCTGQGAQYPGMGRNLFERSPVFRDVIERCSATLGHQSDGRTLIDVMNEGKGSSAPIHQTEWTQPAMFALECGLAALWRSWGVEPSAVIGHSAGEFAAATIAGVFALEDGLRLVAERGKLLSQLPAGGAMAALFLSESDARKLIAPFGNEVSIAAINSSDSLVISGSANGIDKVLSKLSDDGIQGHRLHISFAAHSHLVDSALDAMENAAASVTARPARIPVGWNVTGGAPLPGSMPDANYWRRHLREPVRFAEGMSTLIADGHRIFLEIGPHPVLAALAAREFEEADVRSKPVFVGSLRRDHDDMNELSEAVGRLFVEGVPIAWENIQQGAKWRPVTLPTYPFQRSRFWIENGARKAGPPNNTPDDGSLVGEQSDPNVPIFRTKLSIDRHPWLAEHTVHGSALVAGPVYLCLAVEAAERAFGTQGWSVQNFEISTPLRPHPDALQVETRLTAQPDGRVTFSIYSRTETNESDTLWAQHATGILTKSTEALPEKAEVFETMIAGLNPENLAESHISKLQSLGIELTGRFRTLERLHKKNADVVARIALPVGTKPLATSFSDPSLLDGVLQAAGAALPEKNDGGDSLYFLTAIESISLRAYIPSPLWCRAKLRVSGNGRSKIVDAFIHDEAGNCIGAVKGIVLTRADMTEIYGPRHYEVHWQKAPLQTPAAQLFQSPASAQDMWNGAFSALATAHHFDTYDALLPALDRITLAHISDAFRKLGFDERLGRRFDAQEEAHRLSVVEGQAQLFCRLLHILAEESILIADGSELQIVDALPRLDTSELYKIAKQRFKSEPPELFILARCGVALADVLTGKQNPLDLLFPEGSLAEAGDLYVNAPSARTYNGALKALLEQLTAHVPTDAHLRIIEIGGGTGGTTCAVLAALAERPLDYMFTDVTHHFLTAAIDRFGHHHGFSTGVLNIENDPGSQGYEAGTFDIVVAANVLHATQNLSATVSHAKSLLAPGGLLVLLEGVAPERWVDLTFGMTSGWWRFTDKVLRPDYPLVSVDAWRVLLEQSGLVNLAMVGGDEGLGRGGKQQALFAVRAPLAKRRITVIGDDGDLRDSLTQVFEENDIEMVADGSHDVLYIGALALADSEESALQIDIMEEAAFLKPLRLLDALSRKNDGSRLWMATSGIHACNGFKPDAQAHWQAPALGLGHVAALEVPSAWGGLIDLDSTDDYASQADALVRTMLSNDDEDQCAWRRGHRYVPRLAEISAPLGKTMRFAKDGTYLVTGGFGGLGTLIARWLAENGAGRVALLGRNPDPEGPAMTAVREAGAEAVALKTDISDPTALKAALDELLRTGPALRGAFHAAAHLEAVPLSELSYAEVHAMFAPKIEGTLALINALIEREADFLTLFSSTTAVIGAPGFAHYAAANAFLDARAEAPSDSSLKILSLGWGTWEAMRMASDDVQRTYSEQGLKPMPAEDALDALGSLLAAGTTGHRLVANIDWERLKALHETRRPRPMLSGLTPSRLPTREKLVASQINGNGGSLATAVSTQLAEAPASMRFDILARFVAAEAAVVMGEQSGDNISPDRGLFEMGMDSLMSIELRRRLEQGSGLKLPTTLTFNYPNINALAGFLETRFGAQAPVPTPFPQGHKVDEAIAEDYDSISENDIAARLRATLDSME